MDSRSYLVAYSAHGFSYRFDAEVTTVQGVLELPRLTQKEAELNVRNWELFADTVGGRAIVLDMEKWTCQDENFLPFIKDK